MIDFWGIGYDVADRMGLLPLLHQDGYRLEEVRLVNASGERVSGFDARVFQSASHGRFVSLLRGDLAHRIYELVDGEIETIFSDSIARLEQDTIGVTVTFERGSPRRFDLVIGADGLHSNVRALAFGPEGDRERYLGYCAAAFSCAGYPHRDEGAYVSYSVPGRQVARYALRDGRSAFLFVVTRDTKLPGATLDRYEENTLIGIRVRNIVTTLAGLPVIGNLVATRSFADRLELRG